MALKGKKKSRARGSQARRRPGAAPRPSYGTKEKPRWYQTTAGIVIAFIAVVSIAILVLWFFADQRSETRALETQKEELDGFTGQLRGVLANLTPVANELSTAGELSDKELGESASRWREQLTESQASAATLAPPEEIDVVTGLLTQSVALYQQAVQQYALVPSLEDRAREQVAASATASLASANTIFASVIELLDEQRQEVDMNVSGLQPPGMPAMPMGGTAPGTEIQMPPEEGDE